MERESTPAGAYSRKIIPVVQAISSTPSSPTLNLYVLFEGPVGHLELTSLLTKRKKEIENQRGVFLLPRASASGPQDTLAASVSM